MRHFLLFAVLCSAPALADWTETAIESTVEVQHMDMTLRTEPDGKSKACVANICATVTVKETGAKKDLGCKTVTVADPAQKKGCFGMMTGMGRYLFLRQLVPAKK